MNVSEGSNMADPMKMIEEARGQHDLGLFASRVYVGARSEGASVTTAIFSTVAVILSAMMNPAKDEEDGDGD